MLRQFLNDEHLKNAAQIAVIAFFTGFLADIVVTLARAGEPIYLQFHALMGAGIGSYFFSKNGKAGIIYALIAATLFNVIWEAFEAFVLRWTPGRFNLDTKIDIAVVYVSMIAGFGAEVLRKRLNNAK